MFRYRKNLYNNNNMATIKRNGSLIKAIVCIGIVVLNQLKFFLSHNIIYFSHMMVKLRFYVILVILFSR